MFVSAELDGVTGRLRAVQRESKTSQQTLNLCSHMAQCDRAPMCSFDQAEQKWAAGHLVVKIQKCICVLEELDDAEAVLQQQTDELGFVSEQGGEHGVVQVSRLKNTNTNEPASQVSLNSLL